MPVDRDTEDLLREFLGRERRAEEGGYTREAVLKAVGKVAEALQSHQKDCEKRWDENEKRHMSAEKRLRNLEAAGESPRAPALPKRTEPNDDPAEITGAHRIDQIAVKVKNATLESLRAPGADPEQAIRQVVAEEQEALAQRAEFKRLQKKADDEEAERQTEAKERRERDRLTFVAIAGTVGGAGVLWFIQFLASHVH
jgi:ferric-dicitrate binding protein FerR (iron transport regulator)